MPISAASTAKPKYQRAAVAPGSSLISNAPIRPAKAATTTHRMPEKTRM
jgi:hypothetical protein